MSESSETPTPRDPEDTIRILVATDIHLGFDYSKKRGLCLLINEIIIKD